jgi:hypothetical protein
MHAGYGYLQNYLDGRGMPPLAAQLRDPYRPVIESSATELFVARQWSEPSAQEDAGLAAIPGVAGMVHGSFRFDNPGPVQRGDWWA